MKHVLPALVAVVCTLTACETTADRRDLYAPDKPVGPYTAQLNNWTMGGRDNHQSTAYSVPIAEATPPPPPMNEEGEQPPPPPSPDESSSMAPENNVGAPEPTPVQRAMPPAPAPMMPATPAPVMPATPPPPMNEPAPAGDSGAPPAIPGLSQ